MTKSKSHPYHYSKDKNFLDILMDLGVPIVLFFLFYIFYNHFQFNPKEMIKTTGLWAISLLSLTLVVGPLSRIFPVLENLKAYRKVWGILSFIVAAAHGFLVYIFFFNYDLTKFIDTTNPKYGGLTSGLLALIILFFVTMTSNQKALNSLSPKVWKIIQTTSYIALILAVLHFYLMEQVNGVLVIKRLLGKITFWLSIAVIVARILIMFLPSKKR